MEQITVSPVKPLELIVGKTVPYLLMGLVAAATILATSRLLFGVTVKGSWLDLGIVTLIFLIRLPRLRRPARPLSPTASRLRSSCPPCSPSFRHSSSRASSFPFRNMPAVIQAVSYVLPGRYYLAALRAIMVKGVGFRAFGDQVLALASSPRSRGA